jgi:hypothetical protein
VKGIEESLAAGKGKALHPGWVPVLARVPLFQALSKRHLRGVARLAELKRYSPGSQVVRVGARGDAFYVILDGGAQVTPPKGRGKKLGEGDYFGELALLDGAPRSATVTAMGTLTTARISRSALSSLKEEPAIAVGPVHGLVAIVRALQSGSRRPGMTRVSNVGRALIWRAAPQPFTAPPLADAWRAPARPPDRCSLSADTGKHLTVAAPDALLTSRR